MQWRSARRWTFLSYERDLQTFPRVCKCLSNIEWRDVTIICQRSLMSSLKEWFLTIDNTSPGRWDYLCRDIGGVRWGAGIITHQPHISRINCQLRLHPPYNINTGLYIILSRHRALFPAHYLSLFHEPIHFFYIRIGYICYIFETVVLL